MDNSERIDWRQTEQEKGRSAQVIAQLEAAIIAAPQDVEHRKGERRKIMKAVPKDRREKQRREVQETRRQILARCLVSLNTALASLEVTGSRDDSAKIWWIEGLDAPCVLNSGGYYGAKGEVVIPSHRIEQLRAATSAQVTAPQSAAPSVEVELSEEI